MQKWSRHTVRLGGWIFENYVFKSFLIGFTLIEKHRASELWAELHELVVIGTEV